MQKIKEIPVGVGLALVQEITKSKIIVLAVAVASRLFMYTTEVQAFTIGRRSYRQTHKLSIVVVIISFINYDETQLRL
jgi:hypothetical protein